MDRLFKAGDKLNVNIITGKIIISGFGGKVTNIASSKHAYVLKVEKRKIPVQYLLCKLSFDNGFVLTVIEQETPSCGWHKAIQILLKKLKELPDGN